MSSASAYSSLFDDLLNLAGEEGFPHICKIIRRFQSTEAPEVDDLDREQLRQFARFIKARGMLRHPYWNDEAQPHVESHEEEFLGLIKGLYGDLANFLLDELDLAVEPSART